VRGAAILSLTKKGMCAMALKVLVTVDLSSADAVQRNVFELEMIKRSWVKFPHHASAYCVEFEGLESDSEAVAVAESDVAKSAAVVKLFDWDAVCVVS
jgi:hypothetical protein